MCQERRLVDLDDTLDKRDVDVDELRRFFFSFEDRAKGFVSYM